MPAYASSSASINSMYSGMCLRLDKHVLDEFREFLAVDLRLAHSTVQHTVEDVKRFLACSDYAVSYETVKAFLKRYIDKAPKTYNGQVTSLRGLVKEFLQRPELMASFKMAPVDEPCNTTDLTNTQVQKGFMAQRDARAKAIYLFTATTGLHRGEILSLLKENVDFETRAVKPSHFTRKKRSGVAFYNREAEKWLLQYLDERKGSSSKLFVVSDRKWREIWKRDVMLLLK